jgi:hypothetical protein
MVSLVHWNYGDLSHLSEDRDRVILILLHRLEVANVYKGLLQYLACFRLVLASRIPLSWYGVNRIVRCNIVCLCSHYFSSLLAFLAGSFNLVSI